MCMRSNRRDRAAPLRIGLVPVTGMLLGNDDAQIPKDIQETGAALSLNSGDLGVQVAVLVRAEDYVVVGWNKRPGYHLTT